MTHAKAQAKYDSLVEDNKRLTASDFIDCANGDMTSEDLESRYHERLRLIAHYDEKCLDAGQIEDAQARREHLKARRTRWHGFTYGAMRSFPYYRGLDLTKAQRAVLCAFMAASKGGEKFAVAHDWICSKAGVSRSSVKTTLRRLEGEGLINIRERRRTGQAKNLWNEYTVQCDQLLKWAKRLFTIEGSKTKPHPSGYLYPVTTGETQSELPLAAKEVKECRQKAGHYEGAKSPEAIDFETFALVARAALEELGAPLPDHAPEQAIFEHIEALKLKKQPDYKPYFWVKGVRTHGKRRTLLAFLQTHVIKKLRLAPIPDARAWNERETVKCVNRYLSGILSRAPQNCRPELTLGAVLHAKEIYDLPVDLLRAVRAHNKIKAGQRQAA